jgi:hypothetical protein
VATPEEQTLVVELRAARAALGADERWVATVEQRLQDAMGSTERLIAPDGVVSWATTKPKVKVHTDELVALVASDYGITADGPMPETKAGREAYARRVLLRKGLAHEEPGTRRFTAKFTSDEDEEAPDA